MLPLLMFAKFGIYLLMFTSIVAALGTILLPNLFHAALCFVFVLLGIAGVFIAVHAEFLAVVQILIYVGAIMTLVIFAVMMTSRFGDSSTTQHNNLGLPVLIGAAAFFLILMEVILKTPWVIREATLNSQITVANLGEALMGPYIFPFEVIAILLTAALVGAIVVTRKENE